MPWSIMQFADVCNKIVIKILKKLDCQRFIHKLYFTESTCMLKVHFLTKILTLSRRNGSKDGWMKNFKCLWPCHLNLQFLRYSLIILVRFNFFINEDFSASFILDILQLWIWYKIFENFTKSSVSEKWKFCKRTQIRKTHIYAINIYMIIHGLLEKGDKKLLIDTFKKNLSPSKLNWCCFLIQCVVSFAIMSGNDNCYLITNSMYNLSNDQPWIVKFLMIECISKEIFIKP